MSRHGTDSNPAEVMKKALEKFKTATGFLLPMVVSVPRGEVMPRSVRKLLAKRGKVRIEMGA